MYDDASTCLLLSNLIDKRKVDMYVLVFSDGSSISRSVGGVKCEEGTSGCGINKDTREVG